MMIWARRSVRRIQYKTHGTFILQGERLIEMPIKGKQSGPRIERRQFGRRNTNILGWIIVSGRPRIPCAIKNRSPKGAFLELPSSDWLPYRFQLALESDKNLYVCEVTHARANGVGVVFVKPEAKLKEAPVPMSSRVEDYDEWVGVHRAAGRRPTGIRQKH